MVAWGRGRGWRVDYGAEWILRRKVERLDVFLERASAGLFFELRFSRLAEMTRLRLEGRGSRPGGCALGGREPPGCEAEW